MTSASRFSFKGAIGRLGQLLAKADGLTLSHPSDLVNWDDGGMGVNADTVMRVAAVYACDRVIKEAIASSPICVYKKVGKEHVEQDDHPLSIMLNTEPAPGMSAYDWRELLQHWLNMRGNAYCLKVESRRRIVSLIPMHPDKTSWDKQRGEFRFVNERGGVVYFPKEQIWHLKGASDDGKIGKAAIDYCRDSFSNAMDLSRFASRFMRNNGATGVIFEHPGKLKPDTREALKQSWQENQAGPDNAGRPLLAEEGLKVARLNLTAAQMQFIESRKFSRTEIASIFRVPPHMIGDLERATFSNIEQQAIEFVGYSITPWARRWAASLLIDPVAWYNEPGLYATFDLDDLYVSDMKSRYEAHSSAIIAGWKNRNEVRVKEGLNPKPGLDEFLKPTNMQKPGTSTGGNPNDPNNDKPKPADPPADGA